MESWLTPSNVDKIQHVANLVLICSLVITVISTGTAYWMSNVKEKFLRQEIADTNRKAAELEKEAEIARLETEKLKSVVAWRTFSEKESNMLFQELNKSPGSVNLRYMDGDPESLYLAIQISKILEKAGWKIAPGATKPANAIVFGIAIPPESSQDGRVLMSALDAASIPYSVQELPSSVMQIAVSTIPGAPTLMIGSKQPTLP